MSRFNSDSWWSPEGDDWAPPDSDADGGGSGEEGDDPFGLFDTDLQAYLDEASASVDRAVFGDDGFDEEDDEGGEFGLPQPIHTLFDPPLRLIPAVALDDAELQAHFDALMAELDRFNIRLDVCEHYTLREAYRYLLEIVLNEEAYPQLAGSDIDQYFMTHDDCPQCQAEGHDLEDDGAGESGGAGEGDC